MTTLFPSTSDFEHLAATNPRLGILSLVPRAAMTLPTSPLPPPFPASEIVRVARVQQRFDPQDRQLVAATPRFIAYALARDSQVRVIRQDSGSSVLLPQNRTHKVTSVSFRGSLLLTITAGGQVDVWDVDSEPLLLFHLDTPPGNSNESKARAQLHPVEDSVAIAIGRQLYIIRLDRRNPAISLTRAGLGDGSFPCITAARACKDFCFSRDGALIATLDKTGLVRVWESGNQREVYSFGSNNNSNNNRPSTIFFVDSASRFVVVGSRQNHSLRLWDTAERSLVQEIHFPDSSTATPLHISFFSDSDTLIAAHPQRNSIYLITYSKDVSGFTLLVERSLPPELPILSISVSQPADRGVFDVPVAHAHGFVILRITRELISPMSRDDAPQIDASLVGRFEKEVQDPEAKVSSLFKSALLDHERRLESARRSTQALHEANQTALLKLVSDTLTENTGKILHDTIQAGLDEDSPLFRKLAALDTVIAAVSAQQQSHSEQLARIAASLERIEAALPKTLNGHAPDESGQRMVEFLQLRKYEDAIVLWIQSDQRDDLFRFLLPLNPSVIDHCSQVVLLSLAHTIAANLDSHLHAKLPFLERALSIIDHQNPQISQVASDIIRLIEQQLVSISAKLPTGDATLRHIKVIHRFILEKFHNLE